MRIIHPPATRCISNFAQRPTFATTCLNNRGGQRIAFRLAGSWYPL